MRSTVVMRVGLAVVFALAADSVRAAPPSFVNDVIPIFTRLGCNQGACHGKGAGQNGFRLSLRGYAPEQDYLSITREFEGRRISTPVPENSLLLRKPLGLTPHEGGKLLTRHSREYQGLLDWLRSGTPGPKPGEPEVSRLEIAPDHKLLQVGQEQPLLVRAQYSNGHWRDVTWLARFDSNEPAIATVDAAGKVRMVRQGETAIRASFMGQVAVTIVTCPRDTAVRPELLAKRNNFIDDHVMRKLAALRIPPADLCTDAEFVRRVFLDTIGLLPTGDEARAFLADKRLNKRTRLIDALLQRPEFVDYWTAQLADLLQNRKESDHDVRGFKGVRALHEWLRRQVAANRPWDEIVRDVLTATGTTTANPAVGYFVVNVGEQREADRSPIVSSVAQAFLGTRIGCAQCHNHPLEKYTQDDYYHFAAYFSRIRMERREPQQGPSTLIVSAPDPNQNKNPVGVVQPRTGQFLAPRPLDCSASTVKSKDDPRAQLARWITDPHNAFFSGAMVNRLWRHFLGVGLVEPVDDLRATNPPTNPELWAALQKEFVTHRYDLRHLMRVILQSRTYQLSANTCPAKDKDSRFYSHYYVRRLPAEVLLDAICQSTGVPEHFDGYPAGVRAQQLPDPSVPSYFLTAFGRPNRITACACERDNDVSMPQLLNLVSGGSLREKIHAPDGRLNELLRAKTQADRIIDQLYFTTLSRPPTVKERSLVMSYLTQGDRPEEVFADLFWALLNSKNFTFNH